MFLDNRIDLVELFRDIVFEPGSRVAHVNDAVRVGAAAAWYGQRAKDEFVGNQVLKTLHQPLQVFFARTAKARVDNL
jgi:hypothetical protein